MARRILAGVYFCDSLEQALPFFEQASEAERSGIVVATCSGEVVTGYSFVSLRQEGGLLQLKKEIQELEQLCENLRGQHATLSEERELLQKNIIQTEGRHAEALAESQRRQARARELANQQGSVRGRMQSANRLASQLQQDDVRVLDLIQAARRRIAEYRQQEEESRTVLANLESSDEAALKEELAHLRLQYQELDGQRTIGRKKLSEASLKVQEVRAHCDGARAAVSQCVLEVQKLQMETQGARERFCSEYGADSLQRLDERLAGQATAAEGGSASNTLSDEQRQEFKEEASKLRARILREGEVDSTSIQRYEEEQSRLDNLETQKADLESAASTLRKTIERLTSTSERRFVSTFHAVRENFSHLAPRLYGGGRGSLELLDPAHPLDSGVEIVVRPPGKKLKTIELMSGGEKALCAIALIFAMFLHRPSPLCVLDEVDAPLDEANLIRYLALVKEMSTRTQFIMITHNKHSMGMADHLVGVTMQQPGASKIISVSLQEACAQVA